MSHVSLNDAVYFTANFYHPVSGFSYAADAAPAWYVYESGATPILNGTMTARSTVTGSYWGSFNATAANGFVSQRHYDVQVSGAIAGITGFAKVKEFVLGDIYDVNVVQVSGQYILQESVIDANLVQVSGVPITLSAAVDANITQINGEAFTLADAVSVSGVVDANVVQVSGQYVSIDDFGGVGGTGASAAEVWGYGTRTLSEAVSVSGVPNVNVVQVSGEYVNIDSFKADVSNLDTTISSRMPTTHIDATAGVVDHVTLVDTTTTNTDMRGTNNAALAATALSSAVWTSTRAGYLDNISNLATKTSLESVSGVLVARTLVSADYFDPATDTVAHVTLVDTTTDVTNNVGVDLSTIESKLDTNKLYLVAVSGDVVTILADTNELQTNQSNWLTATGFSTPSDILSVSGSIIDRINSLNDFNPATTAVAVSGIVDANTVQISGVPVILIEGIVDANIVQVSGEQVSINDFKTDISSLDADIYFAQIKHVQDTNNDTDEFVVHWFRNDQPVSSGELTTPALSVYNTSTGTAVIEHESMNYASPNIGSVRYNSSPIILASGEPYLVETSGTISSSVRTWRSIVGIDVL